MINKDIQSFAIANWGDFTADIAVLSRGGETGKILANNREQMYCFDSICESLCPKNRKPTSVDGISFQKGAVTFVEFKSGFKSQISTKEFDREKAKCEYRGDVCEKYLGEYKKRRDSEKKVLQTSLIMKAIESYVLLEKQILPQCMELPGKRMAVRLLVVIDEDGTDGMLDILSRQSNQEQPTEIQKIKDSLKRFNLNHDGNGNDYYYDRIDVISAIEFKKKAKEYAVAI